MYAAAFSDVPLRLSVLEKLYGGNDGIHVLDEDWDNLIILDACRYDVFEEVNYLDGDLSCTRSRGTATAQFLRENFTGRQAHDIVYITGNAVVGTVSESLDVFKLVGLWGENESKPGDEGAASGNLADPEPVVEKTLEMHERYPNKRIIAHLLPPHQPYLIRDGEPLPEDSMNTTFEMARNGGISAEEIRAVYAENVEHALGYVEDIVAGLDGKSVVTSDHGELLGETVPLYATLLHPRWPFTKRHYFRYAHYRYIREPELVNVPWLEMEGERRTVKADDPVEPELDLAESTIEHQLEMLGYR